jgi:excisionase family DNA binding protein
MSNVQIPLQVTISLPEESISEFVRVVSAIVGTLPVAKPTFKSANERSQHAIFGGQQPPDEHGLLINTDEVAKLLKASPRTVWKMQNEGEMPTPIRIGRAVRWGYGEIKAWVNAGCPKRDEWEIQWQQRIRKN